jgi:MoaA/NifB/PqqE/SkfB family radical SAM enzyme
MSDSLMMRLVTRWAARYYLGRPDQAELLYIKYPQLRDLWPALRNEACFRMKRDRSFRLVGLNVELTNRCNLSCCHCPRTGPDFREERDMDLATFRRIVDPVTSLRTLLPYQWGEPLLNPVLFEAVAHATGKGIRTMLTTNATLLDEKAARGLLDAGLTRLTVSFEGRPDTQARIRGADPDLVMANTRRFRKIRDTLGSPCALDVSMVVDEGTEPEMQAFRKRFESLADRIQFIPRFVEGTRTRACRELWRGVLVVLSNGDVTVCCADERGRGVIGNALETPLPELFNSDAMRRLRRRHLAGDFPDLCRHCAEYDSTCVSPRFS